MPVEPPTINRVVVFGAAVLYWSTVWIQAKRIRRHIGRSPNVRPRGLKEQLLWLGWILVVVFWLALPWLGRGESGRLGAGILPVLVFSLSVPLGATLIVAAYVLTLWCYAAMGDAWRMGVNQNEPTRLVTNGPYRFMRHPIYSAQVLMVSGVVVLLPCVLSLIILAIHFACVVIKAGDEDSHLRSQLGQAYETYRVRTGCFLRFPKRNVPKAPSSTLDRESLKPIEPPLR